MIRYDFQTKCKLYCFVNKTDRRRPFHKLSFFSSVQFSRLVVSNSLQPHGLQHTRPPCPFPNSQSLLKFMSIELLMPPNHLILCHPLLLPPSILPSIRVFSNKSVLHIRWPKYWSFSFSISLILFQATFDTLVQNLLLETCHYILCSL